MREEKQQEVGADEFLFLSLVKLLSEQAWISLGRVVHPETQETQKDLPQARGMIDLLGVLEKRTQGNLGSMEEAFLKQELTNLRLTYVSDTENEGEAPAEGTQPETEGGSEGGTPPARDEKDGRVVEADEEGRPKVVDRRSSTADTE